MAGARSAAVLKSPAEPQVTDAERILIRALASAHEMQTVEEHLSARDGAEEEFDPARQARFALEGDRLHEGLATEALMETILAAGQEVSDVMGLSLSESDRRLLASILLKEDEELTADRVEGAIRALKRIRIRRRQDQVQREIQACKDPAQLTVLLQERVRLKQALMDPGLADDNANNCSKRDLQDPKERKTGS